MNYTLCNTTLENEKKH